MQKIVLLGAGGHAVACIDVIEQCKKYSIAGLIGKKEQMASKVLGYSILGTDKELKKISQKIKNAIISVGQIKTPKTRINLYKKAIEAGFKLPVVKSPYSYVSPMAKIGEGTIIMHGAIVNANAVIGKNCILNTKCIIEHDTIVHDYCHVSTGAILNGKVSLGKGSFVGSGSVIKEKIKIGNNCVISANIFLRKNITSGTVYKKQKRNL
jgi:sugar O-acyltransferase (sialic acid O-acetyltransferase NeuD family)|tara:strand:+ start:585 stop:1211 length:627 start_codon:yes stop_codon:yes gene_type:complete